MRNFELITGRHPVTTKGHAKNWKKLGPSAFVSSLAGLLGLEKLEDHRHIEPKMFRVQNS